MACDWNLNIRDEPDPETQTILCRCRECGRYADLDCLRDFATGRMIVQVRTCRDKGGFLATRESA